MSSLADVPVSSWSYIAEGGANLVVGYTGSDPAFRGRVLRLRKVANESFTPSISSQLQDPSVRFTDAVVIPLLPVDATPALVSIQVPSQQWLQDLAQHIQPFRPVKRTQVDRIDLDRKYAVLAEDLVGAAGSSGSTRQLSVEIKPKWGFLPQSTHLSAATLPIKTKYCRFCLHSLHRSSKDLPHSEDSVTRSGSAHADHGASYKKGYCPLDLYSQDAQRVETAIRALVQTWRASDGRGNNLKIFCDGRMLVPQELGQQDILNNLETVESTLVQLLVLFLASDPLLPHLARLQSSLDFLDTEGLRSLLRSRTNIDILADSGNESEVGRLGGDISMEEYENFVSRHCQAIRYGTFAESGVEKMGTRDIIIAHLLSATFKDCSMIIRVPVDAIGHNPDPSRLSNSNPPNVSKHISASLVDCDVKAVDRIFKYARLDADLIRSFRHWVVNGGCSIEECVPSQLTTA